MKIVNLQQFIFLINSLTRNYFIKEVDDYIGSLPGNHPLFSLSQNDLFSLCYGFEGAQNNYPLKILALFPLLNTFQKVDPYNAYMIGKYAFDKFSNIEDKPFFLNVVNRYISDEAFHKIIKMDASKFELFCDPYYDHFPIFQVYEFLDENSFDIKFKAISFWFKFDHNVRKELKIPFFHADKLQLFLKESKLIANYEGVEYDAQVNPFKWNNVIVVVSAQKVSHYIEVYVNLNKAVFISSRLFTEMPNFEFTTYSAFMFVGPAIRIYQNEMIENDIENIYKNGPSFLGHLNESLIITPFSNEYLSLGKNVYSVKYRGFPSHFLSKKKLNLLFDRMINPNCKENEFNLLVSTCFKIYSLLRNSLRDFFRSILTVYSKVPHFVTSKILLDTFDFFFKYLNKKEMIDHMIGHKPFWSNISKDLLIYAILFKFKNFDFYTERTKLEIFLSTELFLNINNDSNSKLFENLFNCSKNCQTYIHELFTASHLNAKKQEKITQCLIKGNNQNNKESIDVVDEKNISIQCNLYNNNVLMNNNNFPSDFDLICTFHSINPIPFQKTFLNILNKLIITTKNINYIPFDGVYNIFVTTSDNDLKASLYFILLNCEKNSSNSVQFDSIFLANVPQLFNKKEVWTEKIAGIYYQFFDQSFYFSKSNNFSTSYKFTSSNLFSNSNEFTETDHFSETFHFSKTNDFTRSEIFSNSKDFSESNCFSNSFYFSNSNEFSQSESYTNSLHFSNSKLFSKTNDFSNTKYFSISNHFSDSARFSKSNEFTFTFEFTKTDHFSETNCFSKTNDFTISKLFSNSNSFSNSFYFSNSNEFSQSEIYTNSFYFSDSNVFSQSESYTNSLHFSNSK